MTQTRSGSVAVVDDDGLLLGIFTDGDFRRQVMRDVHVLEQAVGDLMTANPVTIEPDALAVELLKIIEKRKIDDILVVDAAGRVVGLVDIVSVSFFDVADCFFNSFV